MTKINNIAKNTSYLTLALILQKIISFTYFILMARNLGSGDLGKYYFAISFTTLFAILMDIGLSNLLTREVAKDQSHAGRLLGNILSVKVLLSFFSLALTVLIINLIDAGVVVKNLVYLSAICVVLDSFTAAFFSVVRGFHNLFFESIASVVFQLIVFASGLTFLYLGFSLLWIMGALVLASFFNFVFSFYVLFRKVKIKIRFSYEKDFIKQIVKLAIPFGIFAVFQRIYTYLDSVLLFLLAGDKYVGLYQVAFKIIFSLQFLPMAFTASLYPAMSNYWIDNKKQLAISFERAMNYLIIISLPISIGIITLADKIILLLKPEYIEALLPMQVIVLSLLFIFVNFPIGSLLNACDRQKNNTINMVLVTIISVILNLLLIPEFKALGAGITVLVTNFLMFVLGMIQVFSIIEYNYKKNIIIFLKTLLVAVLMGAFVFFVKSFVNVFVAVMFGGVIYFVLLFLVGGFRKDDVASIVNSLRRR